MGAPRASGGVCLGRRRAKCAGQSSPDHYNAAWCAHLSNQFAAEMDHALHVCLPVPYFRTHPAQETAAVSPLKSGNPQRLSEIKQRPE
jgi:hypothetical protein